MPHAALESDSSVNPAVLSAVLAASKTAFFIRLSRSTGQHTWGDVEMAEQAVAGHGKNIGIPVRPQNRQRGVQLEICFSHLCQA